MNEKTLLGLGLIALAWWWLHPVTSVSVSYTIDDPLFTGSGNVVNFPP